MSTHRRFLERTTGRVRVDREAGIIFGVKLLGRHSRNGREYTHDAMAEAVPLYSGKKVFVNHPTSDQLGEDRRFEDWVGVLHNPRFENGGIYADVHLRTKSPKYEELLEAAEAFHDSFGMSHVADGVSRTVNGREIIEQITEVFSVDLVTEPATCAGLFESDSPLRHLCENIREIARQLRPLADEPLKKSLQELADAVAAVEKQRSKPKQESRHRVVEQPISKWQQIREALL